MGTLVRYLTPGERLIYASRRHTVVLSNSFAVFLVSLVLGVVVAAQSHRWPAAHLGLVGTGIVVLGTLFFAWRAGHWALTRYVITNERILLVEGLIARRITALPLRLVIDTTYRRTIVGRILGYCNLELNLSGHPGLRSLTRVPNADRVYALILRLLSGHEDELVTESGAHVAPAPDGDPVRELPPQDPAKIAPTSPADPGMDDTLVLDGGDTVRMKGSDTVKVTHRLPPN
jgi:Bacterial PH domain